MELDKLKCPKSLDQGCSIHQNTSKYHLGNKIEVLLNNNLIYYCLLGILRITNVFLSGLAFYSVLLII